MSEKRDGFDFCSHDAEPDYCDSCLYIRQLDARDLHARVKLAVETINTHRENIRPKGMHDYILGKVLEILINESKP